MRRVLLVLAATAVLAGCGSTTPSATRSTTPSTTPSTTHSATFTSRAFGYSVSYDPRHLRAHVDQSASGKNLTTGIPGVGDVRGDTQVLTVDLKGATSTEPKLRGEVLVTAVKPARVPHTPTLAEFQSEHYLQWLQAFGLVSSPAQKVDAQRLAGIPLDHAHRGFTSVAYVLCRPRFVYFLTVTARTKDWPSVAPTLNAVAQTFTATP